MPRAEGELDISREHNASSQCQHVTKETLYRNSYDDYIQCVMFVKPRIFHKVQRVIRVLLAVGTSHAIS